MTRAQWTGWLRPHALADRLRGRIVAGRVLLMLTGLLLAVMPVTEHLWAWDRFFRGGQDVEFGLLTVAAVFCLALLLSQSCRQLFLLRLLAAHAQAQKLLTSRVESPSLRPQLLARTCGHTTPLQI